MDTAQGNNWTTKKRRVDGKISEDFKSLNFQFEFKMSARYKMLLKKRSVEVNGRRLEKNRTEKGSAIAIGTRCTMASANVCQCEQNKKRKKRTNQNWNENFKIKFKCFFTLFSSSVLFPDFYSTILVWQTKWFVWREERIVWFLMFKNEQKKNNPSWLWIVSSLFQS